jgi:hypothetical protein
MAVECTCDRDRETVDVIQWQDHRLARIGLSPSRQLCAALVLTTSHALRGLRRVRILCEAVMKRQNLGASDKDLARWVDGEPCMRSPAFAGATTGFSRSSPA